MIRSARYDRVAERMIATLFAAPVIMPVVIWAFVHPAPLGAKPEPSTHLISIPVRTPIGRVEQATTRPSEHLPPMKAELSPSTSSRDASRAQAQEALGPMRDHVVSLSGIDDVDGITLLSRELRITLSGIEPYAGDTLCTRLDGVREPCDLRIKARIHALTARASVTCHVKSRPGQTVVFGTCRAGRRDLAEDLIRNGLARSSATATQTN
jgi:endonuclease YncB( thermonuclease family)